nr:MAG TPA: ASCH domain protein [Caudoviricetes sp.]
MSRELPILFNTEMVRAILDGRKSCTRRIIKPQPQSRLCYTFAGGNCGTWGYPSKTAHESWGDEYRLPDGITDEELQRRWKPPYRADDILYVRETWYKDKYRYMYRANYSDSEKFYRDGKEVKIKWHPSIHMPKEAARIWLKVTDVRVEQLQDIDGKGCVKEGIEEEPLKYVGDEFVKGMFHDLWDSTIKKSDLDRYGWDANPWVFVYEFERCKKPKGV